MVYSRKSIRPMNTLDNVEKLKLKRKNLEPDGMSRWKGRERTTWEVGSRLGSKRVG